MRPNQSISTFAIVSIVAAVLFLPAPSSSAHPDLVEQIDQLTAQLQTPKNPSARLEQRADLYRRHGQYEAALIDIAAAEKLTTNSTSLLLTKARTFCDAGMSKQALASIQLFIQNQTNQAEGYFIRARSEVQLGQREAAVADYSRAIRLCSAPVFDLYLERARQQALLGNLDEAVRGLDEAMSDSAPVPTLQMPAIEYDRQRGAFDSALKRVDGFLNRYPVKEPWLTLRAEILEQAGRIDEARATYQIVIIGIEEYPRLRRELELSKQLAARAKQGLTRTQKP